MYLTFLGVFPPNQRLDGTTYRAFSLGEAQELKRRRLPNMSSKEPFADWHGVRLALAKHLEEARVLLRQSLSDLDLNAYVSGILNGVDLDNAFAGTGSSHQYGIFMRKIELHIDALLLANRQRNVHSAGVHTRVLLECAGEIVPTHPVGHESESEALERIVNAQDYFANAFLMRMSRGGITKAELEARVTHGREAIGLFDGKQPMKVTWTDRVAVIKDGRTWYAYLSECFCHTSIDKLKRAPGLGGVLPSPLGQLEFALAFIMHCAITYICRSLMAFGRIRIIEGGSSRYFDCAGALFRRARWTATPFLVGIPPANRSVNHGEQA